jgi:hypothetical protein
VPTLKKIVELMKMIASLQNEQLQKRDDEIEQLRKINAGQFWPTIEQVLEMNRVDFSINDFENLFQEICPNLKHYRTTKEYALDSLRGVIPVTTTDKSTENSETRKFLWPTDIFGTPNPLAEIAHLLPASPQNSYHWFHAAAWALALKDNWTSEPVMKKAIQGAYDNVSSGRVQHTGLKHQIQNKIKLPGQSSL